MINILQTILQILILFQFLVHFTNVLEQYCPEISDLGEEKEALVMFYSPGCIHCQNALPIFTEAGLFAYRVYNMRLVRIDLQEFPQNKRKYKISAFPTFKYYYHGNLLDYDGDYQNLDDFETWISAKNNQIQIMNDIQLRNQIVYLGELSNPDFYTYRSAVFEQKQIYFKEQRNGNQIIFFTENQEKIVFKEEPTIANIQRFVKQNQINPILTFNDSVAKEIVERDRTTLFLIDLALQQDFITLQKKVAGFITLCLVPQNPDSRAFYEHFNFTEVPTMVLLEFQETRAIEYHKNATNAEQMDMFVEDYFGKKLLPKLKSGPPPAENQSLSIKEIVSQNFHKKVYNNESDVIVYFYNNECGFCQRFDPVYEKVSLQYFQKLLFFKIDNTQNEVLEHHIKSTPSVFLYKKGGKKFIEWKTSKREEQDLLKFIQEHI